MPGPAVGNDGTVYAASNAGVLHAIDLGSGRDRWTFDGGGSYGSDLSTSPAVLANGNLLWPGPNNTLTALTSGGSVIWRMQFGSFLLSPVVGSGARVYVQEMDGNLHAIDLQRRGSPRERWSLDLGDTSYSSPAIAPDGDVLTTVDSELAAIDDRGSRAHVRWRVHAQAISEVSPAVGPDGTSVLGTNDSYEYGVNAVGKVVWRFPRNSYSYSSAAVTPSGLAAFGDHLGYLNIVRARDGRLVQRHRGLGRTPARRSVGVWTAPAFDREGTVYFGTRPGHIYGFTPSGRKLFDIDAGATVDSNPALAADGTLLIGSESGDLYAIGR